MILEAPDRTIRRFLLRPLIFGIACFTGTPAVAAFSICNQTLDIANVAIGQANGVEIDTKGWWVIAPNRCASVVPGDLGSRYLYFYAQDVRGNSLNKGAHEFCLLPRQFEISGAKDCWPRGYATAKFQEVDTHDAKDWTLFLRQPPAGGAAQ